MVTARVKSAAKHHRYPLSVKRFALIPLLLIASVAIPACHRPATNTTQPLVTREQSRAAQNDPHTTIEGALPVQDGPDLSFSFEITTKGNGAVAIGNLLIRLYDAHDDGAFFDPPMLEHSVFLDAQGRFTGLYASGVQVLTPEQGTGELARRTVRFECRYEPNTRRIIVLRDDAGIAWQR